MAPSTLTGQMTFDTWRRAQVARAPKSRRRLYGGVAQLGERRVRNAKVVGSIPSTSTGEKAAAATSTKEKLVSCRTGQGQAPEGGAAVRARERKRVSCGRARGKPLRIGLPCELA